MGTSLVAKYQNAELLTRLIKIEDSDDLLKQVHKRLQQEFTDPLVCNEEVAKKLECLVKQYAKGSCTSVNQIGNLKIILQLITVIASFSKDSGLITLLQHGLLFSMSEMILAAVQCVKGPRGEEAIDLFEEAMKTIRVISDHSQKANEMVCEHYFHRITQLVTSEKFLMLRNEALTTVKYILMECPERIRVSLESKPKVKSYVEKLGQMLKNTTDMSLQTEIIKVLSLLMVKVDRRNVARIWFDFDDDLDDFLQLLENASALDSNVLSFLHKFNCITYSSPLPPPPPPPVAKRPKSVSKQPDTPLCPDKENINKQNVAAKEMATREKKILTSGKELAMNGEEREMTEQGIMSEVECIPESEQENIDHKVRTVPESQMCEDLSKPISQQSVVGSGTSVSKPKRKASLSDTAVRVVITPKLTHQEDNLSENSNDETEDVVAGTPDISGNKSKSRPTFITPKSSRSSVIRINRNETCSSAEDLMEPSVVNNEVAEEVSQRVIPDSNPMDESAPTNARKVSVPVEQSIVNSQEQNRIDNQRGLASPSIQGSQESVPCDKNMPNDKRAGGKSRKSGKPRRGKKRNVVNSTQSERQTRRSAKSLEQSQASDSNECPPVMNEKNEKTRQKGRFKMDTDGIVDVQEKNSRTKKQQVKDKADEVAIGSDKKDTQRMKVNAVDGVEQNSNANKDKKDDARINAKDLGKKNTNNSKNSEENLGTIQENQMNSNEKDSGRKCNEVAGSNGQGKKTKDNVNENITEVYHELHRENTVALLPVDKLHDGSGQKRKRQREYETVVTSVSPILGTPASVYDFQDDMPEPLITLGKFTRKSTPTIEEPKPKPKGRGKYSCKGLRAKTGRNASKASPKRQGTPELQRWEGAEAVKSKASNDQSLVEMNEGGMLANQQKSKKQLETLVSKSLQNCRSEEDNENPEITARKHGQVHQQQRQNQQQSTVSNSPQSKKTSVNSVAEDCQEVDEEIDVVDSATSVDERPAGRVTRSSPRGICGSYDPVTMVPIKFNDEDEDHTLKQDKTKQDKLTSRRGKKPSKKKSTLEDGDNSDIHISPTAKIERPSRKEKSRAKSRKQSRSEDTSDDELSHAQQNREMNKNRSKKNVTSEDELLEQESSIPMEEIDSDETSRRKGRNTDNSMSNGRTKSKQGEHHSKKDRRGLRLSKGETTADNPDVEEQECHIPPGEQTTVKKITQSRQQRRAAKKIKSYEEVEIDSFSQDSMEAGSIHLSQAHCVNARIDTPCPFKKTKQKKTVLISEKENSVINFSQESREGVLSQRSKQGSLWSIKKKPNKGYDKTYSRPKPLSNRTNMFDFSEHSDDDLVDDVPSPTPSPPCKTSNKGAGKKATKTTRAQEPQGQKPKGHSNVVKPTRTVTVNQMDQMIEECRKSLTVEVFSDEEAEKRPAKRPKLVDRRSDINSKKTPVKSRKRGEDSTYDSIELPRGTPFATPYLVDASPDMPVFNREEFMAEMRSLINFSDESSRADPSVSLVDSPSSARKVASDVRRNISGESAEIENYQKQGEIEERPVTEKRIVSHHSLTPASSRNDNFPEIEDTPYQETWTTPVNERRKSTAKKPAPVKRKVSCHPTTPATSNYENFPEIEETPYLETIMTPAAVEKPKSPTPSPPQLQCPELTRFEDENESEEEEDQGMYSMSSLGRITPGLFRSGDCLMPSIDTPLPYTPMLSDKEDEEELDVLISEEIENFSYSINKSISRKGKSNKAENLKEMAKILQDEIKHAEEELLHAEQYIYMFVAFYENLKKRMHRLKQFQLERIQRLEEILLKISDSNTTKEAPLDNFEEQMKKLEKLFQSSFNQIPTTSKH